MNTKNYNSIACISFLIIGFLCVLKTCKNPIADFGNYYYGSKLYLNHLFTKEMYTSIFYFNNEIGKLGGTNYFENYIPVPPISALFYTPFCFFKPLVAKFLFNVLSLIVFSFSLYKLLNFIEVKNPLILLLPLLFVFPLYNNINQGQTYLLIISGLMLAYVYTEHNKTQFPAILLALCISLKLFPAFILLYFILTKKYKIVAYTLLYVFALFLTTLVFIHTDAVIYFCTQIVPRLLNNDIVGSYSSINQSMYSLLLNVFTKSSIEKTIPVINLPILVPIIESVCIGVILYYIYANKNARSFFIFGLVLFSLVLINRYNTTYSLVLLIPLLIYILNEFTLKFNPVFSLLIICIAINLPIGLFTNYSMIIKFLRIILLTLTFILLIIQYKVSFKIKPLLVIIACIFLLKHFTFSIKPFVSFEVQNSKGILYDLDIKKDSLVLKSIFGEKHLIESIKLKGKAIFDENLTCTNNILKYNGKIISNTTDNKLKPFVYNDSIAVFISDLNQGIRFYKLRCISLNGK